MKNSQLMTSLYENRINGVLQSRIKSLIAQLNESKNLEHGTTKGILREKYLSEFIKDVLPKNYSISGGFVCDVLGNISLQHDLILSDLSNTPSIFLSDDISLVPIEMTISTVEVKSTLTTSDLEQINSQVNSVKKMQPITEENSGGIHGVRHFIFAYKSQIKNEDIHEWFDKIPRLFGICVLDNSFVYRSSNKEIVYVSNNNFSETLTFISSLLHSIVKASEERPQFTINIWRRYITGLKTVKPSNFS